MLVDPPTKNPAERRALGAVVRAAMEVERSLSEQRLLVQSALRGFCVLIVRERRPSPITPRKLGCVADPVGRPRSAGGPRDGSWNDYGRFRRRRSG